jgi:ribosome-associated protein
VRAQRHEERRAIATQHGYGHKADHAGEGEATPIPAVAPDVLKSVVERSLDDDKAQAVTVIDLAGKSTIADHMVIASGTSRRQVAAMADHLMERIKAAGIHHPAIDGQEQGDWVLIDAGDVVVHLFRPEVRAFYNLEKMWGVDLPDMPAQSVTGREEALHA